MIRRVVTSGIVWVTALAVVSQFDFFALTCACHILDSGSFAVGEEIAVTEFKESFFIFLRGDIKIVSDYGLELFFVLFPLKGALDSLNLALVTTVKTCLRSSTQNKTLLPHSRCVQISVQKLLAVLHRRGLVWAWSIIDILSTERALHSWQLLIIDVWSGSSSFAFLTLTLLFIASYLECHYPDSKWLITYVHFKAQALFLTWEHSACHWIHSVTHQLYITLSFVWISQPPDHPGTKLASGIFFLWALLRVGRKWQEYIEG